MEVHECIAVGCVPSAAVATEGPCIPACTGQKGGGGVCPGGVSHTPLPPVNRMTDACENVYLAATTTRRFELSHYLTATRNSSFLLVFVTDWGWLLTNLNLLLVLSRGRQLQRELVFNY